MSWCFVTHATAALLSIFTSSVALVGLFFSPRYDCTRYHTLSTLAGGFSSMNCFFSTVPESTNVDSLGSLRRMAVKVPEWRGPHRQFSTRVTAPSNDHRL